MSAEENEVPLGPAWGRRLNRGETVFWYGLAGVTYVVLSIYHKFLLNWIIGPLWLVALVWAGPALVDRVTGRRRKAPQEVPPASASGAGEP
jgi:hypothetical protein